MYKAIEQIVNMNNKRIGFVFKDESNKIFNFLGNRIDSSQCDVYFKSGRAYLRDGRIEDLKIKRVKLVQIDGYPYFEISKGLFQAVEPVYVDNIEQWMFDLKHMYMEALTSRNHTNNDCYKVGASAH